MLGRLVSFVVGVVTIGFGAFILAAAFGEPGTSSLVGGGLLVSGGAMALKSFR